MKSLNILTRMIILVSITSVVTLFIRLYGVNSIGKIERGVTTKYNDRVVPLSQPKLVSDLII